MLKKFCIVLFTILAIVTVLYAGTAREDLPYQGSPTNSYYVWTWAGSSDYKTQLGDLPGSGTSAAATIWKNIYFVDTSATDHGDTSEDGSLADVCTNDVSGNSANVELPGNTTYTVSTDYTVPANINLVFQKGAVLSIDSGKTLTINGTIDAGPYQIFSGSGTVTLAGDILEHDAWMDGSGTSIWPIQSGTDLGSLTYKFDELFLTGDLTIAGLNITGNILPSAGSTYDLGSDTYEVKKVHTDSISGYGFKSAILTRPNFAWVATDSIQIGYGRYYIASGSGVYRLVWWGSTITLSSMSLTGADWYYLYLDGSAIETAASDEITDYSDPAQMYYSTAVPIRVDGMWVDSATYQDRCILAFWVNSSNQIVEFFHDGGDLITWADQYEARATAGSVQNDWSTEVELRVPDIALVHRALVTFRLTDAYDSTSEEILYWRTEGQTGSTGHYAASVLGSTSSHQAQVIASATNYKIDIKISSTVNGVGVYQSGYYLPGGM